VKKRCLERGRPGKIHWSGSTLRNIHQIIVFRPEQPHSRGHDRCQAVLGSAIRKTGSMTCEYRQRRPVNLLASLCLSRGGITGADQNPTAMPCGPPLNPPHLLLYLHLNARSLPPSQLARPPYRLRLPHCPPTITRTIRCGRSAPMASSREALRPHHTHGTPSMLVRFGEMRLGNAEPSMLIRLVYAALGLA
jgi:hypothetical protein